MGAIADRIRTKLETAFSPVSLTVADDSAMHAGHAGAREGGESHFSVEIVAAAFSGLGRIDRHRAINAALAEELAGPVHALVVKAKAPEEV